MKNVLITGCSSGLGFSLSENKNNNIFSHYRTFENPQDNMIIGDLTDKNFLLEFDNFLEKNQIDVLINNAGIYHSDSLINFTDKQIFDLINTNLISPILLTKRICKHFQNKNNGMVININSLAGKNPSNKESVYCASKFGLSGFSKSLQLELIGSNIKIIDLYLGAMKTRMTTDRSNYENLINPDEVSELIYEIIENKKTYYSNEIVIRKNVL